jgi:hypothetical protein
MLFMRGGGVSESMNRIINQYIIFNQCIFIITTHERPPTFPVSCVVCRQTCCCSGGAMIGGGFRRTSSLYSGWTSKFLDELLFFWYYVLASLKFFPAGSTRLYCRTYVRYRHVPCVHTFSNSDIYGSCPRGRARSVSPPGAAAELDKQYKNE